MSHTVTDAQLAANRANAQRSTGPRTPEGKARSSQNARTHGLRSETYSMLRLEGHGELQELQAAAFQVYRPVNAQEVFAVERIALCQLNILRAHRLETGTFIDALNSALNDDGTPFVGLDPILAEAREHVAQQNANYALAQGLARLNANSNHFALIMRYQALADRQYRRAIEDFERLHRLRAELPNEPIYTFQPPPPLPLNPSPNEPISAEVSVRQLDAGQREDSGKVLGGSGVEADAGALGVLGGVVEEGADARGKFGGAGGGEGLPVAGGKPDDGALASRAPQGPSGLLRVGFPLPVVGEALGGERAGKGVPNSLDRPRSSGEVGIGRRLQGAEEGVGRQNFNCGHVGPNIAREAAGGKGPGGRMGH